MSGVSLTYCPPAPDARTGFVTVVTQRCESTTLPVFVLNGDSVAVDLQGCEFAWSRASCSTSDSAATSACVCSPSCRTPGSPASASRTDGLEVAS